ncbi:MAG: efflux RND transporter periplasmic adaptor subunit [Candidatus Hydrogenedentales bacterium]|jgi:HlyD family secretion protein
MSNSIDNKTADVAKTLGVGVYGRKHRLRRFVVWLIVVGAGAAAAVAYTKQNGVETVKYETLPVTRGNLVMTVSATGTLEPIKEVDVGIEVSGTIKSVEVDYNDQVKVGQVLACLDTSKLEAQALQTEAALKSAQAKLLQAQATVKEANAQMARLEEVHRLSEGKMPSQFEIDSQKATLARAHADEASAKASVAQAQATWDANRSDLSKAVVHSPIDGVVLTRDVEPGQTVAAQFESPILFTLAEDLTKMELQVDVDEADVGKVKEGQEATFTVDAYPDQKFPARTKQVRYGSETVDGVVTYKAVLEVDNSALTLRPGMTATAVITVDKREDALLVPNMALRFAPPVVEAKEEVSGGSLLSKILPHPPRPEPTVSEDPNARSKDQQVWFLREGQLTSTAITKGMSDGVNTEVLSGDLQPGAELVTDLVSDAS